MTDSNCVAKNKVEIASQTFEVKTRIATFVFETIDQYEKWI